MNSILRKNKSFFLKVKKFVNSKFKIDLVSFPTSELDRRTKILNNFKISTVLDVGANIGQFGSELRSLGYKKKIISFEPTSEAFSKLKKASKKDLKWDVFNYSLGHFDGETEINISKNSVSSSILDNLPQLLESAPEAKYIKKETIKIKKLDTLFNELNLENQNIYLKIDTQGFEENILNGGLLNLSKIKIIQIEMALVQSYSETLSFEEMTKKLNDLNFKIFSIESGYYDKKTGRLLEVDGIFINELLE